MRDGRTEEEWELRGRVFLSVYACAYEIFNDPLVGDFQYDKLSEDINPTFKTGYKELDDFFSNEYQPDTGLWIHKHPRLEEINCVTSQCIKVTTPQEQHILLEEYLEEQETYLP